MYRYTLIGILKGHNGPINTFTFNASGTLLKLLRGLIGCALEQDEAEFMEVSSLRVFSLGDSVENFAFDHHHQHMAISSHYGKIRMLQYQQGKFVELWEDELLDAIPRALFFSDNGHSLTIYAMETGMIGYISQCQVMGNILVNNMHDGFDIYPPNCYVLSCTYCVESVRTYFKAGVFGEGGKIVVCGSDHGHMTTASGLHLIASRTSSGGCNIYIWKRPVRGVAHEDNTKMAQRLLILNVIFSIIFMWLTREAWSSYLGNIKPIFCLLGVLGPTFHRNIKISSRVPQSAEEDNARNSPSIEDILLRMNEEQVRKVLKISPMLWRIPWRSQHFHGKRR
ncbi:hypothetical protein CPB84DRAFT_1753947 [Gymnopilus junonius]|uniref:Uncharacterized protein n=1 Tax=Gymnopilus junonius TaxID=109634 RepID=A0A9P5N899_GYMJU|nr:hypothetical protein CPB84DRAFT_1753947 [Gymnopilus junonius]